MIANKEVCPPLMNHYNMNNTLPFLSRFTLSDRQDYPRPQLQRSDWRLLNGWWQWQALKKAPLPLGTMLARRIRVPFPVQSVLGGLPPRFRRAAPARFRYKRFFRVPAEWRNSEVRMHFGAVDWSAQVYVNGLLLASHSGGFTPFFADLGLALRRGGGPQRVEVDVFDPGERGGQPLGKQRTNPPPNIFYTGVSGIWQSVWIERIPPLFIESLEFTPRPERGEVLVSCVIGRTVSGALAASQVSTSKPTRAALRVRVYAPLTQPRENDPGGAAGWWSTPSQQPVAALTLRCAEHCNGSIQIPQPQLWSPAQPWLYSTTAQLWEGAGNDDGRGGDCSSGGGGSGSSGGGGGSGGDGSGCSGGGRVGGSSSVLDEVQSYFGMRSVSVLRGQGGETARLALNGEATFMAGLLDQGYWPDGLYTAPSDAALSSDLVAAKRIGMNMIRKHGKLEPARWYYHADRLGILVWQDIPTLDPAHSILAHTSPFNPSPSQLI